MGWTKYAILALSLLAALPALAQYPDVPLTASLPPSASPQPAPPPPAVAKPVRKRAAPKLPLEGVKCPAASPNYIHTAHKIKDGKAMPEHELGIDIRITRCDGSVITAKNDDAGKDFDNPQQGVDQLAIAPHGDAVAWTAEYGNCCTSYPIPMKLILYRHGTLSHISPPDTLMIWDWKFTDHGKTITMESGPMHGNGCTASLHDVATAKEINEWPCDDGDKALTRRVSPQ